MLVCLACYGDRVAALLETATELRLYRVDQKTLVPCGETPVPAEGVLALIDLLCAAEVGVLICGGLSGCALAALQQSGISVAPWIGGAADEVAQAWAEGGFESLGRLRMPGCGLGECAGPGNGRGCRRNRFFMTLRSRAHKARGERLK